MSRSATGAENWGIAHSQWLMGHLTSAYDRGVLQGAMWRATAGKPYMFTLVVSSHGGAILSRSLTEAGKVYFHNPIMRRPFQMICPWGPHGKVLSVNNAVQTRICRGDYNWEEVEDDALDNRAEGIFSFDHDYILTSDDLTKQGHFHSGVALCVGDMSIIVFDIDRYAPVAGVRFSDIYYIICAYIEGFCQGEYNEARIFVHMLFCRGPDGPVKVVPVIRPAVGTLVGRGGQRRSQTRRQRRSKSKTRRVKRRRV